MKTLRKWLLVSCFCRLIFPAGTYAKPISAPAELTTRITEPAEICPFEILDRGRSPLLVMKLDHGSKIIGEFAKPTTEIRASFGTFAVSVTNILSIARADATNTVSIRMAAGDQLTCNGGTVTVNTPMGTLTFPMTRITRARVSRVVFVDHRAQGRNNGLSWNNAFPTIDDALMHAVPGDEIWVASGCYTPNPNGGRESSITLKHDLALYGGFAGTETRRSQRNFRRNPTLLSGDIGETNNAADNSHHVVTGAKDAVLDGFTIANGNASGRKHGGAMTVAGTPMLIRNCVFTNNHAADNGGAVHLKNASARFVNCVFDGNVSGATGGALHIEGGSPLFSGCVFTRNTGRYGVMSIAAGRPSFRNCTFALNHGTGNGSIGTMKDCEVLMESCLVWSNTVNPQSRYNPDLRIADNGVLTLARCFFSRGIDDSVIRPAPGRVVVKNRNFAGHPGLVNDRDPDGPDNIWGTADDGLRPASWSKCRGRGASVKHTRTDLAGITLPAGLVSDIGAYNARHTGRQIASTN